MMHPLSPTAQKIAKAVYEYANRTQPWQTFGTLPNQYEIACLVAQIINELGDEKGEDE